MTKFRSQSKILERTVRKHCECCGLVDFTVLTKQYLCISDQCVTHVRNTREHGNVVSQAVIRGCVLEGDWMVKNGFNHHPENEGEYACTCHGDKCNEGVCGYKARRRAIEKWEIFNIELF